MVYFTIKPHERIRAVAWMYEAPASYCRILDYCVTIDICRMVDAPVWGRGAPAPREIVFELHIPFNILGWLMPQHLISHTTFI